MNKIVIWAGVGVAGYFVYQAIKSGKFVNIAHMINSIPWPWRTPR